MTYLPQPNLDLEKMGTKTRLVSSTDRTGMTYLPQPNLDLEKIIQLLLRLPSFVSLSETKQTKAIMYVLFLWI